MGAGRLASSFALALAGATALLPAAASAEAPAAAAGRKLADLPYGASDKQRIDVYLPAAAVDRAPILVMVHGGAWMFGDKGSRGVVGAKAAIDSELGRPGAYTDAVDAFVASVLPSAP